MGVGEILGYIDYLETVYKCKGTYSCEGCCSRERFQGTRKFCGALASCMDVIFNGRAGGILVHTIVVLKKMVCQFPVHLYHSCINNFVLFCGINLGVSGIQFNWKSSTWIGVVFT